MRIKDLQEQLDTATFSLITEESEWPGHGAADPWSPGSSAGWYPVGDPTTITFPWGGQMTVWQWQWHEPDGTALGDPINMGDPSNNPNSNLWTHLPPNPDGTPREVPKIFDPNSIEAISNQPFDLPAGLAWQTVEDAYGPDPGAWPLDAEVGEWVIINQDGAIIGGPYDFSFIDIPDGGTPGDYVQDSDPPPDFDKIFGDGGDGGGDKGGGGNDGGGGV